MVVAVFDSGTQTATLTTEHVLTTINGPGTYQFFVDTANMVAQDVVELRVKMPVLASGTTRVLLFAAFYGVQSVEDVLKESVPFIVDSVAGACTVTLKQTFGAAGRAFPWKVSSL